MHLEESIKSNLQGRTPKILTEEFLKTHYDQFMYLEREWKDLGEVPWKEENFFLLNPKKWNLSSYVDVDDRVVGYTIVSEIEENVGFLHKIVVDRDYQGLRIGSALFEDMVEKCRKEGIRRINFKSRLDNESANHLYDKYGCKIINKEISPDGVERYIFEKIV